MPPIAAAAVLGRKLASSAQVYYVTLGRGYGHDDGLECASYGPTRCMLSIIIHRQVSPCE